MNQSEQIARWQEEGFEPGVIPHRRWPWYVRRALDALLIALFFLVVVLAALPLGANRDWAWAPLCILFGLIAVPVACGLGNRLGLAVAPSEKWPLLALVGCFVSFVAFAIWQMSPLAPPAGDAWLFSRAAEILGQAHAPIPAVAADLARNSLLRCIACGLIFLMTRAICRDRSNARWLLIAFAASGVLVVLYGIAMHISTHSCYVGGFLKKQFSYSANSDYCAMSGTFANSNSFACYVGMAMTATLALMCSGRLGADHSPYRRDEMETGNFLDWFTWRRIAQITAMLLLLGGLLFSASRAGFGAAIVGILIFGLLLMRGRWRTRPELGRAFFIGLTVFVVVGFIAGDALVSKFATSEDSYARLRIWWTSLKAIAASPWLGWGLGGFADAYAILQPASILQPNDLAHSTPIEVAVELGVLAAVPAYAVVILPWAICLRGALRRRLDQRYLPIAAFSVAAVAILHSTVDFSLQMPAIGFVVSAMLGMGWAQSFGLRDWRGENFAAGAGME